MARLEEFFSPLNARLQTFPASIEKKTMVDIAALNRALPASQLDPELSVELHGLDVKSKKGALEGCVFYLDAPPISGQAPYINAWAALLRLFELAGLQGADKIERITRLFEQMKKDLPAHHWMVPYCVTTGNMNESLSAKTFADYLRGRQLPVDLGKAWLDQGILDWIEACADLVSTLPLIREEEDHRKNFSLRKQPASPPAGMMFEHVTTAPWVQRGDKEGAKAFRDWLKWIKLQSKNLQKILGQAILKDGLRNEQGERGVVMHRNLLMHWLCTFGPETKFVRYLLRHSASRDVEELKSALIDAQSYALPFDIKKFGEKNYFYNCPIHYPEKLAQNCVGVMFLSENSRDMAMALLAVYKSAPTVLIAPKDLVPQQFLESRSTSPLSNSIKVLFADDIKALCESPRQTLEGLDKLYFVGDHTILKRLHFFSFPKSIQKFYKTAMYYPGVRTIYLDSERLRYFAFDDLLEGQGANEECFDVSPFEDGDLYGVDEDEDFDDEDFDDEDFDDEDVDDEDVDDEDVVDEDDDDEDIEEERSAGKRQSHARKKSK